jgi:hypothetical protein
MGIFKEIKKDEYISLLDASKICDYSQEYLSLRARQGKLQATKLGRNWVTTREWLDEYIKKTEEYKKEHSTKIKKGFRLTPKVLLSLFVALISLASFWFVAEGKIEKAIGKIMAKTDIVLEDSSDFVYGKVKNLSLATVSESSSDTFFSKLSGNISEISRDIKEDISFGIYKKTNKIDSSLLAMKIEIDSKLEKFKKGINANFSLKKRKKDVDLVKNIKDGFNSSMVSIKKSLFKKDKKLEIVKGSEKYKEEIDFFEIMKATSDTFLDYTEWLSNESKIVKASKDAIDYLFSLNRKLKEKVVSLVTLRKDISDNINDIPNKLEQEVRDIVQEEIDNQTTEPEPQQPTTVINNPIKEIQTVVTKTIFDNTYLNASLDLIWKNFAKYDQSIKNLEDLISKTSHPSAPVYISQGLQVGGNGVFDSLNAQIGSFTNLGAGQSLTVGDSSSNDSFVSNAVSTFNDTVAISANSSNPALTLTQNGSGTLLDLGSLFSVGSDGKVIITSTEVPQLQIKYDDSNYSSLVVTANGTTTLNSTGGLILDSATGEVRIASGNELYTPGGHPIRSSGEVILKEIIPIFGYEVPVQCSTSCASPSSATTTRIMTEYPFPSAMTGTTRIHKFIIKYATATTTASSTFTVRNITDSTTTTFDVPASEDTDLNKTKVYITPTVVVPTDGDDWVLDVSIPSGSTMKIYEIFLSAYDVVD